MKPLERFLGFCQRCVFQTGFELMTGFSMHDAKCARCGRLSNLAIVDTKQPNHTEDPTE